MAERSCSTRWRATASPPLIYLRLTSLSKAIAVLAIGLVKERRMLTDDLGCFRPIAGNPAVALGKPHATHVMKFAALAIDYDGTIATDGVFDPVEFPASGRHVVIGHVASSPFLRELRRRGIPFVAGESVV